MKNYEESKLKLQLVIATAVTISGMLALFMGFWVPPIGEISPSVLTAIGECFTFAGSLIGIDYHYKYKHHLENKNNGGGE